MTDLFAIDPVWCPLCEAFTAHFLLADCLECAADVRDPSGRVTGTCGHLTLKKARA